MKKTKIITLISILTIVCVLTTMFILARPDAMPDKAKNPVVIPAHAVEVAPGVFYLGKAIDKGRIVEGYAFMLKDKKGFGKPGTECGNGICERGENANKCPADCIGGNGGGEPDTSSCYGFLARGAKWKTVEPYIVDPTTSNLKPGFVRSNLASNIAKWETEAGVNILGGEDPKGNVDRDNIGDLNGENEVMFADIDPDGVIAVAIVWGIFGGPPFARELVEWDMVFNQVDFDWSDDGAAGKMDFENIATHELGHAVGLDDLYKLECSEQTMYGYASNGETKKRTLESGDIAGIRALY